MGGTDNNQLKAAAKTGWWRQKRTETAAAGAATTAAGMSISAPGIGADGIAFATAGGSATPAVGAATSAASTARSVWRFGQQVAHIVQYFPPFLEEAHAPHSQLEAEEEEAMIGGLCVLVMKVICGGFVCAARPCSCVRLTCKSVPKNQENHGILGIAGKVFSRQSNLSHLIKQEYHYTGSGRKDKTDARTFWVGTHPWQVPVFKCKPLVFTWREQFSRALTGFVSCVGFFSLATTLVVCEIIVI
jgi:hypothetical protein